MVATALFADVMPARESTAAVLLLLICGDLFASYSYRHDVEWRTLLRLAPSVLIGVVAGTAFLAAMSDNTVRKFIGVVAGTAFLAAMSDNTVRKFIGVVIVLMCTAQWFLRSRHKGDHLPHAVTWVAGTAAGFTSMIANAGGPPMALYLLNMHISVRRYLGTTAWFFFALNLTKLPFSVHLGLLHAHRVESLMWYVPLVGLGAWLGRRIITRISADTFQVIMLVSATAGGLNLLLR